MVKDMEATREENLYIPLLLGQVRWLPCACLSKSGLQGKVYHRSRLTIDDTVFPA